MNGIYKFVVSIIALMCGCSASAKLVFEITEPTKEINSLIVDTLMTRSGAQMFKWIVEKKGKDYYVDSIMSQYFEDKKFYRVHLTVDGNLIFNFNEGSPWESKLDEHKMYSGTMRGIIPLVCQILDSLERRKQTTAIQIPCDNYCLNTKKNFSPAFLMGKEQSLPIAVNWQQYNDSIKCAAYIEYTDHCIFLTRTKNW